MLANSTSIWFWYGVWIGTSGRSSTQPLHLRGSGPWAWDSGRTPSRGWTLRPLSGEALYDITVAYAQLERGILRERILAVMDRARKQGHRIGRPRVTDRKGFRWILLGMVETAGMEWGRSAT